MHAPNYSFLPGPRLPRFARLPGSGATWAALAAGYDTLQLMDVVFAVGQYTLIAMAMKSFAVPLDKGLEGF